MSNQKRYSLNDIFELLKESTSLLRSPVTVVSEDDSGKQTRTRMAMYEFIAMSVGHELSSSDSRLASGDGTPMATKEEVIEVLDAHGFDEVAYPVYENFGIMTGGRGGRRKTRRT